jgi:hypothetical protein
MLYQIGQLSYVGFSEEFLGIFSCTFSTVLLLFSTVRCSLFSVFLYLQMLMAGAAQLAELWCGMPCAPSRLQRSSKGMEAIMQLQFRRDRAGSASGERDVGNGRGDGRSAAKESKGHGSEGLFHSSRMSRQVWVSVLRGRYGGATLGHGSWEMGWN